MFFLVTSGILGVFFKRMTADDKYSHHFRENFVQPIQMLLSKKPKVVSLSFITFPRSS